MQIAESIEITGPKEKVWAAITDIEHCVDWINNIKSVEVLDKPESGIVGLKWMETRDFCGKEATETMWITEAEENLYYATRAESHGSVYISRLSLEQSSDITTLTMSFKAQPQSLVAKILSALMNIFIAKSLAKEVQKDLNDIKHHVEDSGENN